MKNLIAILLLAVSSLASAASDTNTLNSMGFNDLPEAERAAVLQQVAAAKQKLAADKGAGALASTVGTPERVGEWLDIGTKIGQMFGGAAKEVGIAVNDFVKTPVGKWTMAIIIWKYMGAVIIHFTAGVLILFFGSVFAWLVYRAGRDHNIEYDLEKKNVFGNYPVKHKHVGTVDSDYVVGACILQCLTVAVCLFCIFTF